MRSTHIFSLVKNIRKLTVSVPSFYPHSLEATSYTRGFRYFCSPPHSDLNTETFAENLKNNDAKQEEPLVQDTPSKKEVSIEKIIEEKDKKINELKSELLYALAEVQNTRKIADEEVRKAKEFGIKELSKDMLDVVDCLENAVQCVRKLKSEELERIKSISAGISMTLSILIKNLERHHVVKLPLKVGENFDYNYHEAVYSHLIKPDEVFKEGQITAIIKTGYQIGPRVLRAAQVGVAEKPPTVTEKKE